MPARRCLIWTLGILLFNLSACRQNTDYGGGSIGEFGGFWQKNGLQTRIMCNPYSAEREPTLVVIRRMPATESRDSGGSVMGTKGGVERSTWTLSENNKDWFTYDVVKEPVTETLTILGREYSLEEGRVFLLDSTQSPPGVTQLKLPIPSVRPDDKFGERDFNAAVADLSATSPEVKTFVADTR